MKKNKNLKMEYSDTYDEYISNYSDNKSHRITSYNVCYTKLLRNLFKGYRSPWTWDGAKVWPKWE